MVGSITRTEVVTMLRIKVDWARPTLPEFDPVKHDPERTFAFLTYRGVNYAKWVYLKSTLTLSKTGRSHLKQVPMSINS